MYSSVYFRERARPRAYGREGGEGGGWRCAEAYMDVSVGANGKKPSAEHVLKSPTRSTCAQTVNSHLRNGSEIPEINEQMLCMCCGNFWCVRTTTRRNGS